MLAIGKLRKRVRIQENRPVKGPGDLRGERPNWVTVATVWGAFDQDLRVSHEQEVGPQQKAVVVTKVTIRYWPGLTPEHRLLLGTRAFAIDALGDKDEKNRVVEVWAKEVR